MKNSDKFLNELAQIVRYWVNITNIPSKLKENETEKEYIANGIIHSILVLLYGNSSISDFTPYHLYRGKSKVDILDEYLASKYYKIYNKGKDNE